jgi:hypothetical protein
MYKGQFTLTSPVQWGNLVLQPGTYQFSLPSAGYPCTLYIQGNGHRAVLNSAVCGQEPRLKAGLATANLKIVGVNGRLVVRELDLPSVGLELDYDVPKRIRLANGEHSPEAKASRPGKQ